MNDGLKNPNSMMDSKSEEESLKSRNKRVLTNWRRIRKRRLLKSKKRLLRRWIKWLSKWRAMSQEEEEELEEDMDALRALLENIISSSFEEEALMNEINHTDALDPRYIELGQAQRNLKDDAKKMVEDLYALSLRVVQIASAVNRRTGLVNHHMEKRLAGLATEKRLLLQLTSNM